MIKENIEFSLILPYIFPDMAHLQKKGSIYYLIDKSSGKPKWIKLGALKHVEAKAVLTKYESDQTYLRLGFQNENPIKFEELCKLYLEYAATVKSPRSVKGERGILNLFCKSIGERKARELALEDLENLYSNKDLASHTIRLRIDALRALYKFAVQRGYLRKNIALELKRPRAPILPPKHVDLQIIDQVFQVMSEPVRIKFQVLYFTGMRPSEMLRLQAQDIDLEKRSITVRYSKTKRFRLIPIHRDLFPILEKLMEGKNKEDYLFSSREGTAEKHQVYIDQTLRRACKRAKVTGVTPYVFRHQFATMVYNNTKDLRAVQQLLGHTDIRTTTRYATALNDQLVNAVETL